MKAILGLIFNKLVWIEDRLHFKLVCKLWWKATQNLKDKPPILFKQFGEQWWITSNICRGWISEKQDFWIQIDATATCKNIYVADTTIWENVFGKDQPRMIKYNGDIKSKPRRLLDPVKGFFNKSNIHRQLDGRTLVWIGRADICLEDGKVKRRAIFTEVENIQKLNEICMNAFREIKNRR